MSVYYWENQDLIFDITELENGLYILQVLETLRNNGLAVHEGNRFSLPIDVVLNLSKVEKDLLKLPSDYPFGIEIGNIGLIAKPEFRYKIRFLPFKNGQEMYFDIDGAFLVSNGKPKYLLSQAQYELLNLVNECNASIEAGEQPIRTVAKVQTAANKAVAEVSHSIASQLVIQPESLNIDINTNDNGEVTFSPGIMYGEDSEEQESINQAFSKDFRRSRNVKDSYTGKIDRHKRSRIIFNEEQVNELENLLPYAQKPIDKSKAEDVLLNPQNYFDATVFDLDTYSKRVSQLGFYKPKYYNFVSKQKEGWVPGLIIEKGDEERIRIVINDEEELEHFEEAYQQAIDKKVDAFDYEGCHIPTEVAGGTIETAKGQFENIEQPYQSDSLEKEGEEKVNDKRVLIIYENLEDLEHAEQLVDSLKYDHFESPPNLRTDYSLLQHQKEGLAWMQALLKSSESCGGLLADDMGLGKTLQVLALIDWHHHLQIKNKTNLPYLIVAPVTLLENWIEEFYRFFDSTLTPVMYYGKGKAQVDLGQLNRSNLVLTSYETLRRDQLNLCKVHWAACFLDEAQRIKTPGTLVTNAAKALKANLRMGMTGTPVENTLLDFWCLMDFSMPSLLGSAKDFKTNYQTPLEQEDPDYNEVGNNLRAKTGFYVLRRLKKNTLPDLPQKSIYPVFDISGSQLKVIDDSYGLMAPMPNLQRDTYLDYIENIYSLSAKGCVNKGLRIIWAIRTISDHPYLIDHNMETILSKDVDELIETSGKLESTIRIIDRVRSLNEKVIVFSDRRKMQLLLQKVVSAKYEIPVSIINGESPTIGKDSRQQTIDKYQAVSGFNVIIMSPISAGYGLNVKQANHVIHYTRHWNPAKEAQATDRVYRIGQEKDVHIYYPMSVMKGMESFDVKLARLLAIKTALSDSSMFPSEKMEVKEHEFLAEFAGAVEGNENIELRRVNLTDIESFSHAKLKALLAILALNVERLKEVRYVKKQEELIGLNDSSISEIRLVGGPYSWSEEELIHFIKRPINYEGKESTHVNKVLIVCDKTIDVNNIQIKIDRPITVVSYEDICHFVKATEVNYSQLATIDINEQISMN
ncbi:MAG: DEAD/DEAH box helicase [Marinilabiliaceae bacterium]|nr:DEAD/DEAH box helicase [Marinilabiliaceae bacterium]